MSYTRPDHDAAAATWQGAGTYTRPAAAAADATWQSGPPPTVSARPAAPSPLGAPAVRVAPVVAARAAAPSLLGAPAVLARAVFGVNAWASAPSLLGAPAVVVKPVIVSRAAAPALLGMPAALARLVVQARPSAPSMLAAPAVVARVLRYEIRGAVRQSGVALVRRVRCYRLSDGALLGESDTVLGRYRVPAGLVDGALCYLVPLDLSPAATDYRPVCANRVAAVLADDLAEIPA